MKKGSTLTSNTAPVAELRKLLAAVSDHGEQHLDEVETDLHQTTYLLSGAIDKLSANFLSIHKAITAQQQEIDELLSAVDIPEKEYQTVLVLRKKIAEEVDAAVTGLQFQDMTSQLITRVIERVDGLRESLGALAIHGQDEPAHKQEEIVKLLNEMSDSLDVRHKALVSGLTKSVAQRDMNAGDIELF